MTNSRIHDRRRLIAVLVSLMAVLIVIVTTVIVVTSQYTAQRPLVHKAGVVSSSNNSIDFNGVGSNMWAVTITGNLYLSTDGGGSWTEATPPVSFNSLNEPQYSIGVLGTTIWVVAPNAGADELFRSSNNGKTWSVGSVIATTAGRSIDPTTHNVLANAVHIDLVSALVGFIAVDHFFQGTDAQSTLDESSNGGASFVAKSLPTFGTIRFVTTKTGFLFGGPGGQHAYATDTAGASWVSVDVEPPIAANYRVGAPWMGEGTTFSVPVSVTPTGRTSLLYIMHGGISSATTSSGASVAATTPTPALVSGNGGSGTILAGGSKGSIIAEGGSGQRSYHSTTGGASWTSTSSGGLPSGWATDALVVSGRTSAVVGVTKNTCVNKAACTYEGALYLTTDAGASWSPVQL